jgi:methylated-DNA-protein-cysteine methyltransferase-like protein
MNFKDNVIEITKQIPLGKVTTYGTIATLAGIPRGARIVGGILHFAPDDLNLPWQRVVNRNGFISTKCIDHPKEAQRAILEQEGVAVSDEFIIDLDIYGWWGPPLRGKLEKR